MTATAAEHKKLVYRFDEGDASRTDLLGGKAANLCEMTRLGLPIPPGFVLTTEACLDYYALDQQFPPGLRESIELNVHLLEKSLGRGFGSAENPLLVSVRSGAKISMPGMMDTILNLGINDDIVLGLASLMGDPRPAYDAYRRFLQIYADVVMGVEPETFEHILAGHKSRAQVHLDYELNAEQLRSVIDDFKTAIRQASGADVPSEPWQQLSAAVETVFKSWRNPRAVFYRDYHGIPHNLGTAVTIMAMVFGNRGPTSGTGVLFTRNPSTGLRGVYGEFLSNAQGEDVVAGVRTPQAISSLGDIMPELYQELMQLTQKLEGHYRDVQDVEFTIEDSRLFLLQTRSAKRTALASVKTAVDMATEGLISRAEALRRIDPGEIVKLLVPQFAMDMASEQVQSAYLARGFGASPGAATGKVCFDATRAATLAADGVPVILVRSETKPDDIHGMTAAAGVLTSRGGVTSHAAVVTRGLGKSCIVGCEALQVNYERRSFSVNGRTVSEGEDISIDGATGEVYYGRLETVRPRLEEFAEAGELLSWADESRKLGVLANADTPADATQAVAMGAEGIGLCRTEHMFLSPDRLPPVRQMLLTAEAATRWRREHEDWAGEPIDQAEVRAFYEALDQVRKLQTDDFAAILRVMGKRPVLIRLLDAPLHEFLPPYETVLVELAEMRGRGSPPAEIHAKETFLHLLESMREANPMLGHRGCRLGLSFPAIYQMQVEAIIAASANLAKQGIEVRPNIMIPLTAHVGELARLRRDLTKVTDQIQERLGVKVPYKFGTMIEVPRAALTAGEIAREAEFFSFGTNDLTQTTYGFSRDDAEGKFLQFYIDEGILPSDPFSTIDPDGVGELIRIALAAGRRARPDLEVGVCGELGGDPASIAFFHKAGLNYVSCSPYRVPGARLAAAQAALADAGE